MTDKPKLTTNAGAPVADNQNIMTAGPRGPALLQDVWYLEKLAHFDREVIPERHMHGFGSHTFSLINAKDERFWVKFHLVCQQGIRNLTDAEAEAIIAKDRESHQRDLYESIEKRDFPRWKMFIQVMPEKDAAKCPYNPFDLTKVWLRKDYPLIEVGVMELNRSATSRTAMASGSSSRTSPSRRSASTAPPITGTIARTPTTTRSPGFCSAS